MTYERLRLAREEKGWTIEELSRRAGIRPRTIELIDRGEFGELPAGLYGRASIRSYATAVGLDAASRRGLHHGALSPESVLVTEDGDVKLIGLATTAALADHDDEDGDVARRIDAIGLVGLAYAGLSGRWPLPGDSGGLPSAPRIVGGVAAPSEIAVGVPADLDAICRLTLNDDAGPDSPGDFAGQIAPWSPTQASTAARSSRRSVPAYRISFSSSPRVAARSLPRCCMSHAAASRSTAMPASARPFSMAWRRLAASSG